jgi:hypothetical protein
VSKLVFQLSANSGALQAPMALAMLVRYTARLLADDSCTASESAQAFKFLLSCLRNKAECVVYEAARAICRLPGRLLGFVLHLLHSFGWNLIRITSCRHLFGITVRRIRGKESQFCLVGFESWDRCNMLWLLSHCLLVPLRNWSITSFRTTCNFSECYKSLDFILFTVLVV